MTVVAGPGAAELRGALVEAAEWVSEYLATVAERPVVAQVEPGALLAALPEHAPEQGEPLEAVIDDLDTLILPGITHWNHPAFFAYFGISGSGPGIVGELIASALNVNAMLWRTSPAATELEQRTLAWVLELLGLPEGWFGQITDTASSSTFYALAAAREALGLEIRKRGMAGRSDLPALVAYTSAEAHSSVEKACIALGLGTENVRKIATDDAFAMRADLLEQAIAADVEAGRRPMAVIATVGTTSTTSVDPVPEIADVCARHGIWLHVDAAYGGAAGLLPTHRQLLAGCERADSLVFNPHKWLLTPVDCSLLYTSRPDALRDAFSVVPFYLTTTEQDVVNLMDYGLALGRRFRALKLWFVLRAYGADGAAPDHRRSRRDGVRAGVLDRRRAWLGATRANAALDGLLPLPPRGRGRRGRAGAAEHRAGRGHQPQRRGVRLAHPGRRPLRDPDGDRQHGHPARARGARLGPAAGIAHGTGTAL